MYNTDAITSIVKLIIHSPVGKSNLLIYRICFFVFVFVVVVVFGGEGGLGGGGGGGCPNITTL